MAYINILIADDLEFNYIKEYCIEKGYIVDKALDIVHYKGKTLLLHETGVGPIAAATYLATELVNRKQDEFIIVGTCGSSSIKPMTVINPYRVYFGDLSAEKPCFSGNFMDSQKVYVPTNAQDIDCDLITMGHFVSKTENINKIEYFNPTIHDMETAAFLYVLNKYNKNAKVYKCVTDFGDINMFRENVKNASIKAFETMLKEL